MKWILWGLTSSHMNTIRLTEATGVSTFSSYPIYAIPKLFRDYSMQEFTLNSILYFVFLAINCMVSE